MAEKAGKTYNFMKKAQPKPAEKIYRKNRKKPPLGWFEDEGLVALLLQLQVLQELLQLGLGFWGGVFELVEEVCEFLGLCGDGMVGARDVYHDVWKRRYLFFFEGVDIAGDVEVEVLPFIL